MVEQLRLAIDAVFNLGRTPSFRPMTYVVEGLAQLLFGLSAGGVFFTGFLKYVIVLLLIGAISDQFISVITRSSTGFRYVRVVFAISMVCATASLNSWQGIVSRTGPSEALLAIGFLSAAYGFLRLGLSEFPKLPDALLVISGVIIAAGAKESGTTSVLFLIACTMPLIDLSRKSHVNKLTIAGGVTVCALFPANSLIFVLRSEADPYGNERNTSTVVQGLLDRVTSPSFLTLMLAVLLALRALQWMPMKKVVVQVFLGTLLLIWVLDGAIYELDSPNPRYRMLYQLIEVLIVGCALGAALLTYSQTKRQLTASCVALCLVLNGLVAPIRGIYTLKSVNQAVSASTSDLWSIIEFLSNEARTRRSPVVLVSVDGATSYEPFVALATYLHHLHGDIRVSVLNAEPSDEVWNSTEWEAVQEMQEFGRNKIIVPLKSVAVTGWICVAITYTLEDPTGPLFDLVNEKCDVTQRI